jgi:hypothetical protein
MSLPVPTASDFSYEPSEEEFMNPKGQEDEGLLATGAWGSEPEPAAPKRVRLHFHND